MGGPHRRSERASIASSPRCKRAELAAQWSDEHSPGCCELAVRDPPVVAPHERHRRQPPFAQLVRARSMEVSVAAPPDAGHRIPGLASGGAVAGKTLEVLVEDEHIGPAGAEHLLAKVESVVAVDVVEGAAEALDGILAGVADKCDITAE